jgi:long-chain acyl-CoA synthetase
MRRSGEYSELKWERLLQEKPPAAMLNRIKIEAGPRNKLLTLFFKIYFRFILRIFWNLRIDGQEFLPKKGPYLICPNHASFLDGFFIFASLPANIAAEVFFVGYSIIFDHPLLYWAGRAARLVSLDPNIYLTETMQAVSYILRQKKIVCIFPEGRRAPDESVGEFKKGAGILIKELDIPVVPVYIKGSYRSWPRTSFLPRFCPVKVIFGRPVSLKGLAHKNNRDSSYAGIAAGLREEVLKLAC